MSIAVRNARRQVGDTAGFDADAAAYIRSVQSADGASIEPAVAFAINSFVLGCKADGVWTPIKACCILIGARTLSGALTPLVGTSPTNTNFVSGDYDRKTGLKGNGSNKYISTGRANNADPQNDNHNAVYVQTASTGNAAHLASNAGVTGQNQIFYDNGTKRTNFRCRTTASDDGVATLNYISSNPTGFLGFSRAASGSYTYRYSGTNVSINITSQASSSTVLRAFDIPGFGGYTSNARLAFYSIGESLTLASLDTRVSDLYTAIGSAIA